MTGRHFKSVLLRAAVLSLLALIVVASAVVIVRRNAATPIDTRQILSVTRNGRTVTFVECPECEKSMRIASDGMSATINLCRLRDGERYVAHRDRELPLHAKRHTQMFDFEQHVTCPFPCLALRIEMPLRAFRP